MKFSVENLSDMHEGLGSVLNMAINWQQHELSLSGSCAHAPVDETAVKHQIPTFIFDSRL